MARRGDEARCAVIDHVWVKAGPAVVAAGAVQTASFVPFEPALGVLAGAGVAIGAMIRVGRLVARDAEWPVIRRDILVSLLIGMGNALLVLWLHSEFGLDPLQMLAVAVVVGTLGLEAIGMATGAARRLYNSTVDRLLDERAKARADTEAIVAERMGEVRNDVQAAISAERIKRKEGDGAEPPPRDF